MPYASISQLPANVKNVLPVGAQRIFRSTFNSVVADGKSEASARKIAWSAVKVKYRSTAEGKWVKKELSTPSYTQGSAMVRENLAGSKVRANPNKKPNKK